MCFIKVFALFLFFNCILAEKDTKLLLKSCELEDLECTKEDTMFFLNKTTAGIPELDIKAIDPYTIPEISFSQLKNTLNLKNVVVTGFKHLDIKDFVLDKSNKSVKLKLQVPLNIVANATFEKFMDSLKSGEKLCGSYKANATTIGTINYNYEMKSDDNGVKHFDLSPESIDCKIVTDSNFNQETRVSRMNDNKNEDVNNIETEKENVCKIANVGFKTFMHNLRVSAKLLPASDFFKGTF